MGDILAGDGSAAAGLARGCGAMGGVLVKHVETVSAIDGFSAILEGRVNRQRPVNERFTQP
ncbi:hypothetical protein GCM10023196_101920 [Actinoallomurus vinaceus]|uniref:Uncharacterized protein n=1 Tax=Actinoallomurus vinaceus TaxID=1080074 RepID=A0ABP8UTR3_9ACTN